MSTDDLREYVKDRLSRYPAIDCALHFDLRRWLHDHPTSKSTPVLPEWVHDPATYCQHLRALGFGPNEATVGGIGYDAGQKSRPAASTPTLSMSTTAASRLAAVAAARVFPFDVDATGSTMLPGNDAQALRREGFIAAAPMIAALADEWGVRYDRHPDPLSTFPVPDEVSARALADAPDNAGIHVMCRRVIFGAWVEAALGPIVTDTSIEGACDRG